MRIFKDMLIAVMVILTVISAVTGLMLFSKGILPYVNIFPMSDNYYINADVHLVIGISLLLFTAISTVLLLHYLSSRTKQLY